MAARSARRHTSFVTTAAIVSCLSGSASPQSLCASDEQLITILSNLFSFDTGQGVGICIGNHPSLMEPAMAAYRFIVSTYYSEFQVLDQRSLAIFEMSYPGQGVAARDEFERAATTRSREQMAQFSMEQCQLYIQGIDALALLNDWKLLLQANPYRQTFDNFRQIVPRCP